MSILLVYMLKHFVYGPSWVCRYAASIPWGCTLIPPSPSFFFICPKKQKQITKCNNLPPVLVALACEDVHR